MADRYDTSLNLEAQYQSGSNNQVLVNKLGIINIADMNQVELDLLAKLYDDVLDTVQQDQSLTVADLSEWHRKWLGNVYEWAGKLRTVNMGKGDFHFAAVLQLPRLLHELDNKYLRQFTPCHTFDNTALVEAIALVHVEFILIHPFREGNGRLSRLLANVMALQAGLPALDFSAWDAHRDAYFLAIQQGMDCNYEPMKKLVRQVLLDTEKNFSE